MSTPSNAIYGAAPEPQGITPRTRPAAAPFYWSVRRELWENRAIYIAPLAVAALIVLGFLIGAYFVSRNMSGSTEIDPIQQRLFIEMPYHIAAALIMGATFLVAVFYCLDALHGERRDRSILFWKSLPVSDLTTVLSKVSIPMVVLPLVTFAVTLVTQLIILLIGSAVLSAHGLSAAPLWERFSPSQILLLLYHLFAVHGLWYAPIYCWLLLVSAWARRAAFLWAVLPVFAIAVVEKIAFNTSYFATMLAHRLSGGGEGTSSFSGAGASMDLMTHMHPAQFLMSPGLWSGLAVAAVFLVAAIQLRRYRGPI